MVATDEKELRILRSEWEAVYGHPLTEDEFQELEDNLAAFFGLLYEWELADRAESDDCGNNDAGLDGEEYG